MAFNYGAGGAFGRGLQTGQKSGGMLDWILKRGMEQYFQDQATQSKAEALKAAYSQLMPELGIENIDAMTQLIIAGESPERYFEGVERSRDITAVSDALEDMGMTPEEAKVQATGFASGMPLGTVLSQMKKGKDAAKIAEAAPKLFPGMSKEQATAMGEFLTAGGNLTSGQTEEIMTTRFFDDWLASEGYTPDQASRLRLLPPSEKMKVMATGAEKLLRYIQTEQAGENLMELRRTLPEKDGGVDFANMTDKQRADFMGNLNAAIPPNPADNNITQARNYVMYGQFTNPHEDGVQRGALNESDNKLLEELADPKYDNYQNLNWNHIQVVEKAFNIKDKKAWAKFRATGIAGVIPDAATRAQTMLFNRVERMLPARLDLGVAVKMWRDGTLANSFPSLAENMNKYFEHGTLTPKITVIVKEIEQLYNTTLAAEDYTQMKGLGKELFWEVLQLYDKGQGGWEPSFDIYLRGKNYTGPQIEQFKKLLQLWSEGEYETQVRPFFEGLSESEK